MKAPHLLFLLFLTSILTSCGAHAIVGADGSIMLHPAAFSKNGTETAEITKSPDGTITIVTASQSRDQTKTPADIARAVVYGMAVETLGDVHSARQLTKQRSLREGTRRASLAADVQKAKIGAAQAVKLKELELTEALTPTIP